jgi:hypothetical protein
VAFVVTVMVSFAFGALDQYIGSFSAHPWMTDVSLLSAPWLLLPFLAGASRQSARSAVRWGLLSTFAALSGYLVMTLSPVENAHYSLMGLADYMRSSAPIWFAGLISGPGFGWLGYHWRAGGGRWPAAVAVSSLCLEPAARLVAAHPIQNQAVLWAEVVAGLGCLLLAVTWAPQSSRPLPPRPNS